MANSSLRADGRTANQLRPIRFQNHIAPHATGSTLVEWGNTRVICAVTVEEIIPRWMKEQKIPGGWLTAEYSMLPYSTLDRKPRDVTKGKLDGRSSEIQRLIGRSIRAALDLQNVGERTVWIDCDVLQADGGTRTASIVGAWVALHDACSRMVAAGGLASHPVKEGCAAVSVGIVRGTPMLDLAYVEDAGAEVDMNIVMTGSGGLVEVQGTAEGNPFSRAQLDVMLGLAEAGIAELLVAQGEVIAVPPPKRDLRGTPYRG
jgi:ribonuclease PH